MRSLIITLAAIIFFGCKKDKDQPQNGIPGVDFPCPEGYYGENCKKRYADTLAGTWIVYDSVIIDYVKDGEPDISIINTHESELKISGYSISNGDTVHKYILDNFWGEGEVAGILRLNLDSIIIDMYPDYNGIRMMSPPKVGDWFSFAKGNSYTHTYNKMLGPDNDKYRVNSLIIIRKK